MRKVLYIFLFFVLLFAQSCANGKKELAITSTELSSFQMKTFRAFDATLTIGIDNPCSEVEIQECTAVVKAAGHDIISLTVPPVEIKGRTLSSYDIPVSGNLAPDAKIAYILEAFQAGDYKQFTVDVCAKIKHHRVFGKTIEYKDLLVKDILENL